MTASPHDMHVYCAAETAHAEAMRAGRERLDTAVKLLSVVDSMLDTVDSHTVYGPEHRKALATIQGVIDSLDDNELVEALTKAKDEAIVRYADRIVEASK